VFDLPEPQPLVVTEHRAHGCRCAACGAKTRASFPDGVNPPAQYGARITAFVIYLLHYQLRSRSANPPSGPRFQPSAPQPARSVLPWTALGASRIIRFLNRKPIPPSRKIYPAKSDRN
jgi:hypothetical protein